MIKGKISNELLTVRNEAFENMDIITSLFAGALT